MSVTNAELSQQLSELAIKFGEQRGDIQAVMRTQEKIDKALNGNGRPGLIQEHNDLQNTVENHIHDFAEYKTAQAKKESDQKEKKEKFSARSWAVTMLILTNIASLVFSWIK